MFVGRTPRRVDLFGAPPLQLEDPLNAETEPFRLAPQPQAQGHFRVEGVSRVGVTKTQHHFVHVCLATTSAAAAAWATAVAIGGGSAVGA